MGRVLKSRVVAFRCEVRSCEAIAPVEPIPAPSTWHDELLPLSQMVDSGWGVVVLAQLRSYCAEHADRVWSCTCRTHPTRAHLCTAHDADAASHVWDALNTPAEVSTFLEFTKGIHP